MKRNWDMIRMILFKVEELQPNALLTLESFSTSELHEVSYHLEILEEAALLHGKIHKTLGGSPHDFHLIRLTWQGHDFLDAIRTDEMWSEIKALLGSKKVEVGVDTIMACSQTITKNRMA